MDISLLPEFIKLFEMSCVVLLLAYLFSRSRFFLQVLDHRATIATQVLLAVVFGLMSVYGMNSGISFYTANVNIRDFGPMAAGLACGPNVGIGAGIIGFIYRLYVGGTNVFAVAIGPLVAGIVGGLVYYFNNREMVSTKTAILVTFIVECFVSAVALVIRLLAGESVSKVMTVTINVALPMIIMTSIAVGVFAHILHNLIQERKVYQDKLQLELEVESKKNLNTIINTISYPVYVLDRNHFFILVNESFCHFLGNKQDEILGKTFGDFFNESDSRFHKGMTEQIFQTKTQREVEVTITRRDG